jgi:hypothetical protein
LDQGVAPYHPSPSLADIERMEIGRVAGPDERGRAQEIIAKSRPNLRVYRMSP